MRTSFSLAVAAASTLLAGCVPVPPAEPPVAPAPSDECGASGYQGLIGQPRSVLGAMKFPLGTRVIGPNDGVTADYRPERLNIEYGIGGLIERVSCY